MQPFDTEEEALRRAVDRDDFPGAEISARRYTSLLESGLKNLPPAEAEARVRQACSLLDWARHNLHAARARIEGKLGQLEKLSHYHAAIPGAGAAVHTWKIDA
jgi:hypothetical protein